MGFTFINRLPTSVGIREQLPLVPELAEIKHARDEEIKKVSTDESDKSVVIIGPCSADSEKSVYDYTRRLARVQEETKDKLIIIPRVYTNKPRTTGEGYIGMMHQPSSERRPDVFEGTLATCHMHMRVLRETGFSTADEMLYLENMDYLSGMMSCVVVNARSVEDQFHRLVASGYDMPVDMKSLTSGDLTVILNSVMVVWLPHDFIFRSFEVQCPDNPLTYAVLRGTANKRSQCNPNYRYEDLELLFDLYNKHGLQNPAYIVDTNHVNSDKQYHEQIRIAEEVFHGRRHSGDIENLVKGLMIESYIKPGDQEIGEHYYSKSITDPYPGWDGTERLLYEIANNLDQDHTMTQTKYEPGKEPTMCFAWQALFHSVNHSLYS